MRMMLLTAGTCGDVEPFAALARFAAGHGHDEARVAAEPLAPALGAEKERVVLHVQAQTGGDGSRGDESDHDEREQKHEHEHAARAARLLLAREEVHAV